MLARRYHADHKCCCPPLRAFSKQLRCSADTTARGKCEHPPQQKRISFISAPHVLAAWVLGGVGGTLMQGGRIQRPAESFAALKSLQPPLISARARFRCTHLCQPHVV